MAGPDGLTTEAFIDKVLLTTTPFLWALLVATLNMLSNTYLPSSGGVAPREIHGAAERRH